MQLMVKTQFEVAAGFKVQAFWPSGSCDVELKSSFHPKKLRMEIQVNSHKHIQWSLSVPRERVINGFRLVEQIVYLRSCAILKINLEGILT